MSMSRLAEPLRSAASAALAIFLAGCLASRFIEGFGLVSLLASMGASAVILFAVPRSPMAGAWPLVGGHFISAIIGIVCARYLDPAWWSAALAVGLAVFAMHMTRSLHPPGGATALIPVLGGPSIQDLGFAFLLTPLALNVAAMLAAAQIQKRLMGLGQVKLPERPPSADLPSLERIGIRSEDLRAALAEWKVFVDVGESELKEIYQRAAGFAYRREYGEITCERIMSRNLVTVEFGDELEVAWGLIQTHGVKALPVIDRARHVQGIITMSDFFRHARAERLDSLGSRLKTLLRRSPGVNSDKPEVAGQIMSSPAVTVRADTPFADLAPVLAGRGIHQVPVVDERDKLVGLITQSDLIAALYRDRNGPETALDGGMP